MNPGEPPKPLGTTVSGGELSRILLAIKTVLADKEDTPTLIFDEIDSGISGITAGKVAEKLHIIGQKRQVICITHLPQIAAAADAHYLIQKQTDQTTTKQAFFRWMRMLLWASWRVCSAAPGNEKYSGQCKRNERNGKESIEFQV